MTTEGNCPHTEGRRKGKIVFQGNVRETKANGSKNSGGSFRLAVSFFFLLFVFCEKRTGEGGVVG